MEMTVSISDLREAFEHLCGVEHQKAVGALESGQDTAALVYSQRAAAMQELWMNLAEKLLKAAETPAP